MATPKTILLKGDGLFKEALAGGAITPGHLINRNSSNQFVVHGTAAAETIPMFAVEDEAQGKDITDAYASGEIVNAVIPEKGAEIYALVPANAAAIVVGDLLESNGGGTLRKRTPFSQSGTTPFAVTPAGYTIARALEAVDNSANAAGPVRIKVEIV